MKTKNTTTNNTAYCNKTFKILSLTRIQGINTCP
uniref:Uncharacterized protein n=1 Tax=Anguilla anguilla TaxID=7936 RepID=A0A0E9WLL9_ANGAN